MGFEVIKTAPGGKKYDSDKVYLETRSLTLKRRERTSLWYRIVIGPQVWSRLAWAEPDAVVAWGTDEDKGRVRIAPAGPREPSTAEIRIRRSGVRLCALGPLPADAARIEASGPVPYAVKRIDGAAVLFVDLPDGFFAEGKRDA